MFALGNRMGRLGQFDQALTTSPKQQILGNANVPLPLLVTVIPSRGAIAPTFTRASTKIGQRYDSAGYIDFTALSGEVVFTGARRVQNLIPTTSENFDNAAWAKSTGGGGSVPVVTADQDPNPIDGVAFADKVVFSAPVAPDTSLLNSPSITTVAGKSYRASFYVKAFAAGDVGKTIVFRHAAGSGYTTLTLTSSYQRASSLETAASTSCTLDIGLRPAVGGSSGTVSVYLAAAMEEDVTNQTVQTAGDYVSVGVLSSPYHGSMVDGVKCFPTDYSGNPIPTATTYDAVTLNGTSGTYVNTPDSTANSVAGDIDIRVNAASVAWGTGSQTLVGKSAGAGSRSYIFDCNTAQTPRFVFTSDGTNFVVATSSATFSASNGTSLWLRVTRVAATGSTTFYTSTDGVTWTQLGTVQSTTAGSIFDSTQALEVGSQAGGTLPFNGRIYRAQIFNTVGGTTPVVDFDASRYNPKASATTIPGVTGETWTLNGSATLHPSNYPLVGYWPETSPTNLILQSNSFTTTWVDDSLTPVQNVTGPDGATSAWTFTDSNGAYTCRAYQSTPTLTAAAYTLSLFVKKTTGVQTAYPVIQCYPTVGSANMALVGVDTSSGAATAWTAFTGFTMAAGISASCESFNSSYWRVSLTFTGTASAYYVVINPAATTNATQSTGAFDVSAQGTHVFYGAQLELGSFASSYIPTTTAAVQRQPDVLTYTGADVANIKSMACSFSRPVGVNSVGVAAALTDGTANNYVQNQLTTATAVTFIGASGGVAQWSQAVSNAYTPGTVSKIAQSWATNDIKMDKDGTAQTADTSATIPAVTQLQVGHFNGAYQLNGPVNNVYGWTRNLSQSELGAVDL